MDAIKLSRICARVGAFALLVTNYCGMGDHIAHAQGNVQYSWQGPVELLPNAAILGSGTGELRFRESRTNGLDYVSLRGPQSIALSFRLKLPGDPGADNDCVKRGTGTADTDAIIGYPLRFESCGGAGSEWISATEDANKSHFSTVYSNNPTDRVGWVVNRARGTEASPLNTAVGDVISGEDYGALVGGFYLPQLGVQITRQTATSTSVADWVLRTYDAGGGYYDKIRVHNHVYIGSGLFPDTPGARALGDDTLPWLSGRIDSLRTTTVTAPSGTLLIPSNIGNSGARVPKLWVHDVDCDGTGCPGGPNIWSRDSGAGFVYPSTTTDDVFVKQLYFQDYNDLIPLNYGFRIRAKNSLVSPGNKYLEIQDNAGNNLVRFVKELGGGSANVAVFYQPISPDTNGGQGIGTGANGRWGKSWLTNIDHAGNIEPDVDYTITPRRLGGPGKMYDEIWVRSIVGATANTCWNVFGFSAPWTMSMVPGAAGCPNGTIRVGIGTTSASEALHVVGNHLVTGTGVFGGSMRVGGDLRFTGDGSWNIGASTTDRPGNINATFSLNIYNGPFTTTRRMQMTSDATIWYNSSGFITAILNANAGALGVISTMDAAGGYKVNGIPGITANVPVRCASGSTATLQFTLGILYSVGSGC